MFNKGNNNLTLHWAKTGKGQQVATFPWVTADWTSFKVALGNMLGSTWFDDFGNTFMLKSVRGTGGVILGNTLEWIYPGLVVPGYTPNSVTDTIAAPASITGPTVAAGGYAPGQEVNNWFFVQQVAQAAALKTDGLKLIKGNSANQFVISKQDTKYGNLVNDPDAYAVAPVVGNLYEVIRPFETTIFQGADAAKLPPVGIAVQAIAADSYGFTQVAGLAMCTTSAVTLVTAGQCVIPDAVTSGQVKGGGAAFLAGALGIGAATCIVGANGLAPVWLLIQGAA